MTGSAPGTAKIAIVIGPDDVEVCRGADVLVLTLGGNPRPGQTRLDLAGETVAICRDLLPRSLITQPCGVAVQSVHAYIVGEHGDPEIPRWSSATVGAVPILRWNDPQRPALTAAGPYEMLPLAVPVCTPSAVPAGPRSEAAAYPAHLPHNPTSSVNRISIRASEY
jgi:hypothetical protein